MALLQTGWVQTLLRAPWVIAVLMQVVPPLDKLLLRLSRGWLNTAMQSVTLLETIGARSGQRRTIATLCLPLAQDIVLVGSNWGRDNHPAWYHNLRAEPLAQVTFRGYVGPMLARELQGDERSMVWQKLVESNPQYGHYQANTERLLPVLRLSRPD